VDFNRLTRCVRMTSIVLEDEEFAIHLEYGEQQLLIAVD